jgi:hypothetical protein
MPKLPNPPEAGYLFNFSKSTERSETIVLGILDIFRFIRHISGGLIGIRYIQKKWGFYAYN